MAASITATDDRKARTEAPWYAAYPPPKNTNPASITRSEILQWFQDGKKNGKDFLLIDLRRTDYEVSSGSMLHAINV